MCPVCSESELQIQEYHRSMPMFKQTNDQIGNVSACVCVCECARSPYGHVQVFYEFDDKITKLD